MLNSKDVIWAGWNLYARHQGEVEMRLFQLHFILSPTNSTRSLLWTDASFFFRRRERAYFSCTFNVWLVILFQGGRGDPKDMAPLKPVKKDAFESRVQGILGKSIFDIVILQDANAVP